MQKIGATLNFSSGDLVGHLNCRYLTELDLKVANGELEPARGLAQGAGAVVDAVDGVGPGPGTLAAVGRGGAHGSPCSL